MIKRLLGRLHQVFDKNPYGTPVIDLMAPASPSTASVDSGILTLREAGSSTQTHYLANKTIEELVAEINGSGVFTAVLRNSSFAGYLAIGLLEAAIQDSGFPLQYPTNLLYSELQTCALALTDEVAQRENAEKQLYANTAEGSWLDYWLSYFAIARIEGENDLSFITRGIAELFAPKVNNKALMQIISKATGYYVDVRDMGSSVTKRGFRCNDSLSRLNAAGQKLTNVSSLENLQGIIGVYLYNGSINNLLANEKAAIVGIVNKYKASGKAVKYFAPIFVLKCNVPNNRLNSRDFVVGPGNKGWLEVIV
jgi:hypothetical protein